FLDLPFEDVAATRILTAIQGYKARKTLTQTKKIVMLKALMQNETVRKQTSSTSRYLHLWNKIQAEFRARQLHIVTEVRFKQKKLGSQLKHEAALLHELEAFPVSTEPRGVVFVSFSASQFGTHMLL
ncbi:hypothetical protein MKX01_038514, partial [Papaver californicum]